MTIPVIGVAHCPTVQAQGKTRCPGLLGGSRTGIKAVLVGENSCVIPVDVA